MTTAQANEKLDEQVVEIGQLNDAIAAAKVAVSGCTDEVKSTTKEVSCAYLALCRAVLELTRRSLDLDERGKRKKHAQRKCGWEGRRAIPKWTSYVGGELSLSCL